MKLRRILVCLLAFLTASVGLISVIASAQTGQAPTPRKGSLATFIIYRDATGETSCREATPEESLRIINARPGDGQHLIYSGAPRTRTGKGLEELSTQEAQAVGSLPALLPSAGLHIFLHGTAQLEQNQDAKNAFIVAANRWEALISNPINVVIDVDYGTTFFGTAYDDPDILGQTGSRQVSTSLANVRQRLIANSPTASELQLYNALPSSNVPVEINSTNGITSTVVLTRANSRALGISPNIAPDTTVTDARIGFNSAFGFDFNPDDGIASGLTDFDSVVTHEIGHALGFVSDSGGGSAADVTVWDLFRFRPGTANLSTVATAPRVMSAGGLQVFFNNLTNTFNTQELSLSTGGPSGDAAGGDGRQSSHWKDDAGITSRYIGIMDPTIGSGVRRTLTNNDVKAIDSFGYAVGGTVAPPPPPGPPPSNDNFANAFPLQGPNGAVAQSNDNATKEAGEPDHAQNDGGSSVWYSWTSPTTGQATFDTIGSNYDSTLAAYTGMSVGALQLQAENDDIVLGTNVQSRITFSTNAGVTYRIAVDGFDGSTGNIVLNWTSSGTTPTPTPTPVPTPTPSPTPLQTTNLLGRIVENGAGLQGVSATLSTSGVPLQQTITGADGSYAFTSAIVGNNYNVHFFKAGYTFSPSSLTFQVAATGQLIDVTATKSNSIDVSDFFVTKHYEDFLGRQPDASGLNFWTQNIEGCILNLACRDVKRIDTSAAFFLSIEFQNTGYLVERMYKVAYGDATGATRITGTPVQIPVPVIRRSEFLADSANIRNGLVVGLAGWESVLENNKQGFALAFVQRQRFIDAYPLAMTPAQFVAKLNLNTGGALTQTEVDALVAELSGNNTTAGRASVFRKVAENAEVDRRESNRAFVLMQFFGYLQRDPDAAPDTDHTGWKFWLDKLDGFNGDFRKAEMVKAFISSSEYRQRFGQP